MQTGDLSGVLRVYLSAWQEEFGPYLTSPMSLGEIEERGSSAFQHTQGLVAIQATHVIGYLIFKPASFGVEVLHWYVDPKHQGQGVGKSLVDRLLQELPADSLEWWAWQDNLRANQAYQAMGARLSDRRKVEKIGGVDFSYQRWQLRGA